MSTAMILIDGSTRRKHPRRGHTKSRKGCLNCKRRRVKCQETLPECDHCKRLGLVCEYPKLISRTSSPPLRPTSPSVALQSTPTQFSMEDLRFFHHFLLFAYPGLPLGGHSIWQEVAKLSHSYDFLMHAMLGLAASHLTIFQGVDHSIEALTHRVKAVRLLQDQVPCLSNAEVAESSPLRMIPENDARFATTLALAFQASHLADGMDEFLWMIRGCVVVFGKGIRVKDSIFAAFSPEKHTEAIRALNKGRPPTEAKQTDELEAAAASLKNLRPLCQSMVQVTYLAALERIVKRAKTSYVEAFNDVSSFYDILGEMPSEDFRSFMDTSNYASRLLLAHFFVIEYMIALVAMAAVIRTFSFRQRVIGDWILGIAKTLPPSHREYILWPLEYSQAAQAASNGTKLQILG